MPSSPACAISASNSSTRSRATVSPARSPSCTPARCTACSSELAQPPPGAHHADAKGFDRLSCRVADYDLAKQRWHEVVGIAERTRFDVDDAQLVIGQLPIGRCLLELIAPAGPDAPLAEVIAEEGERAFAAFALEVADLDAEIARYRAAGVEPSAPEPGHLPGSRRATISEDDAFGVSIQLIQYA